MRSYFNPHRGLWPQILSWSLSLGMAQGGLLRAPSHASEPANEVLEQASGSRVEGRILEGLQSGLRFQPSAAGAPVELGPGSVVSFRGEGPSPAAIPPTFQVMVGESARISGFLRGLTDHSLTIGVPWQAAEVRVARPGVQALVQHPGEARIFADAFERIDSARWKLEGTPEVASKPAQADDRRSLGLAVGSALTHKLMEPLLSGRIELFYRDDGKVSAGNRWMLELNFRGAGGPSIVRVMLGWAEDTLAVECPEGPSLAVQRLPRIAGWHRLSARFGPEQTDIANDGKELAHGKGPAGTLESIRIAASGQSGAGGPKGLQGRVGEIQVIRFAEPPTSLEIDPSQDEARLVVGDQLFGTIRQADQERILMSVDERLVALGWSEVSALYFRRIASPGEPVKGFLARLEWQASPQQTRELDYAEGAVTAITDSTITIRTPYMGTVEIPRGRLSRLRVLDPGWRLVIDPTAHHLGDNISATPPLFDPPMPEGGILERSFNLPGTPQGPAFLSLDVVQVVGEAAGGQFSNLVLKGELRTNVAVNGKRVDYINRHIPDANEISRRIRIPIPEGLLKAGKNVVRIEQTGIASDPNWFDDLGILQMAVECAEAPVAAAGPSTSQPPTRP